MKLTAELVESLAGVFLSPRYDQAQPTPDFHRECWAMYCSDALSCAIAAPRNHAKSTALTHDYGLANALFRACNYILVIGASEETAIEHLGDIASELRENEDLIREFKIKGFITDQKTDIIVECLDGYQFRFTARGAEQKIRGRKWNGARPGLIICDDLEDDEQILNRDRRKKFRQWFFRACKQALRDGGKIRVHGTILHEDSLLNHLVKNKQWESKIYKAHKAFSDFSEILWPEKFSEARLRSIRQEFINEGDAGGYSQEYLNDPRDNDESFLRPTDFIPMKPENHDAFMKFYVGCDFAISKADTANRTSFTIGGKEVDNFLNIVDQRVGRWDSMEIIEEFFSVEERYHPDAFFVEDGQIWKAIYPMIQKEMIKRDIFCNFIPLTPVKDKKTRGRPLQKRMRAGGVRFDKESSWYGEYEEELLRFTGDSEAIRDDQFDSTATLCLGLEKVPDLEDEDALDDEEISFMRESENLRNGDGRSSITGY